MRAGAVSYTHLEGVRILALPELCLTGYTCGDLFLQDTLIEGAYAALETVRRETEDLDMLLAGGLPVMWHGKLYNCAAVLCRGEVLGLVPKTHLPLSLIHIFNHPPRVIGQENARARAASLRPGEDKVIHLLSR